MMVAAGVNMAAQYDASTYGRQRQSGLGGRRSSDAQSPNMAEHELFVTDGHSRVLTALWHSIDRIEAYVYHRQRYVRFHQFRGQPANRLPPAAFATG
jgi:hypothetical protein